MVTFLVHYFREGYDSDWTDEEVELEFEDPADCRWSREREICLHLQKEGFYEADSITRSYDKSKYFNHRWYGKKTIRVPKLKSGWKSESESESDEEDDEDDQEDDEEDNNEED